MPPAEKTGTEGRSVWRRRAAYLAALAVVAWMGAEVAGALARGGAHPCARLDERLCADLGATDCALWKTRLGRAGAASTQPYHARGGRAGLFELAVGKILGWDFRHADDPLCSRELDPEVYPRILEGVRAVVAAELRKATSSGP
jgi:hypothetical protein